MMFRQHTWIFAVFAVLGSQSLALACKCANISSPCQEFSRSELVFAGRVEEVAPNVDTWSSKLTKRFSEKELDRMGNDNSPEGLQKLKNLYLEIVPEPYKSKLATATTPASLEQIMEAFFAEGRRSRFQVDELYSAGTQKGVDVWPDYSSCGIDFQKGETYVVYAYRDEKGRFTTSACSRTKRLSDAGEDLAYFYFLKHGGTETGSLSGWVTSAKDVVKQPRLWRVVPEPLPYLTVTLESVEKRRLSSTGDTGAFVFERLGEGEYTLSVSADTESQPLIPPRQVHVSKGGCVSELLNVPKSALPKP